MQGRANIDLLELAVKHLGEITQTVAFVGGATVALLITDEAAPDVRPTVDVDFIVEIGKQGDYYKLATLLREKGFNEDDSDDAPLCRFRREEVRVPCLLFAFPVASTHVKSTEVWYLILLLGLFVFCEAVADATGSPVGIKAKSERWPPR